MPRRLLGCFAVAALALSLGGACKGKKSDTGATPLDARCQQLAKACGDDDKHTATILDECKQAAQKQVDAKCTDKVTAAYDCFEKELCGKADKVWALDDFRVLADRHTKCVVERDAARDCVEKK